MDLNINPFAVGLGIGLLTTLFAWLDGIFKRRALVKEVRTLKDHLHTQMEINAAGNDTTKRELDEAKRVAENLRVTNSALKQKPGRAEVHTLTLYDKALHLMQARAPGFAPAWENALKEAETEVQKTETGLLPLIRNVFRPSLNKSNPAPSSAGHNEDFLETDSPSRPEPDSNQPVR